MRIYGNRQLKTLPGETTRPTTGRVREALFNIWQGAIADSRWLDLCAGNGSIGAEALCRGAREVVGIEQLKNACAIIEENWRKMAQAGQHFQVIQGNILSQLPKLQGQVFDRIYFDPPYASELYDPVLSAIADFQLLHPQGEIAAEYSRQFWKPIEIPQLSLSRTKHYGHSSLAFYQVK
ncbi:MAG: 16S rRNA (guanine(966)-N(2))-methyltransferase RsmD [Snowella sp.]|nr:16S rRNA (guanine(966)-N(2))-methyltransferase RsmD [Snowella sp.]